MLYQAELLSDTNREGGPLASGGALIAMPPRPRNSQKSGPKVFSRPAFNRFAGRRRWLYTGPPDGASPSGKALDFDSSIRRFDPSRPSHPVLRLGAISEVGKSLAAFRGLTSAQFKQSIDKVRFWALYP